MLTFRKKSQVTRKENPLYYVRTYMHGLDRETSSGKMINVKLSSSSERYKNVSYPMHAPSTSVVIIESSHSEEREREEENSFVVGCWHACMHACVD